MTKSTATRLPMSGYRSGVTTGAGAVDAAAAVDKSHHHLYGSM